MQPAKRLQLTVNGLVQGVGFRPRVHQLALELNLSGWVINQGNGVLLEIQGAADNVDLFSERLKTSIPPQAQVDNIHITEIPPQDETGFQIRESESLSNHRFPALPDLAPCDHCLAEMLDPDNRRYRYPFTHCSHCGPRYSLIHQLPYDRQNTTMAEFPLCPRCQEEYDNPDNRRFHAEIIACPDCGPTLTLSDSNRKNIAADDEAVKAAASAIRAGKIVAVKSIGGFQLLTTANSHEAIATLRHRKARPAKAFAVMMADIAMAETYCQVSPLEKTLLSSPQRPIVILPGKGLLPDIIAPKNPNLGIMLPPSPLHVLLLEILQSPIIATSGNLAGEPLCFDNDDACRRLSTIADFFLRHNRKIVHPIDDSVVRVINHQAVLFRGARGYAPITLNLPEPKLPDNNSSNKEPPVLNLSIVAVGGHLKNTVGFMQSHQAILGPHIGDLDSPAARSVFEQAVNQAIKAQAGSSLVVAHDSHGGYSSSQWASTQPNTLAVQHHLGHFFAVMAEHGNTAPALGVCWDGSGLGNDGTLWGGEFFQWDGQQRVERLAHLRPFPLPGGEAAIREPRRQALGLLYEGFGDTKCDEYAPFSGSELGNLKKIIQQRINTPTCSSVGRLFDAIAALLGICEKNSYEGQAAMALEFAAQSSTDSEYFPFSLETGKLSLETKQQPWQIDWQPMVSSLLKKKQQGCSVADLARQFHNTLAQFIAEVAIKSGHQRIFLSGGVFQNKLLVETTTQLLCDKGFVVFSHQKIPPNDGGLALGQLYYAQQFGSLATAIKPNVEKTISKPGVKTPCV